MALVLPQSAAYASSQDRGAAERATAVDVRPEAVSNADSSASTLAMLPLHGVTGPRAEHQDDPYQMLVAALQFWATAPWGALTPDQQRCLSSDYQACLRLPEIQAVLKVVDPNVWQAWVMNAVQFVRGLRGPGH